LCRPGGAETFKTAKQHSNADYEFPITQRINPMSFVKTKDGVEIFY